MSKKMKLKIGNWVWIRLPMNAQIVSVNQDFGYTLETPDGTRWSYFDDSEVEKIKKPIESGELDGK